MKTIPYSKFRHGQRITCEIEGEKIDDARISIDPDGMVYICNNQGYGRRYAKEKFGYFSSYSFLSYEDKTWEEKKHSLLKNIQFLSRTLDDLEEGDVVVDSRGVGRKILGKCGNVYFLSFSSDYERYSGTTLQELKEDCYTIKQEEPEEDITELTLAEVAKLANVPVERLRIQD